jgi:hypothetical protein
VKAGSLIIAKYDNYDANLFTIICGDIVILLHDTEIDYNFNNNWHLVLGAHGIHEIYGLNFEKWDV